MIYSDEKGDQLPGKSGAPEAKCYLEKRSAKWEVLCGKEEWTKGVAGARNEKAECQIYAVEHRWGLRSIETSGGASELAEERRN